MTEVYNGFSIFNLDTKILAAVSETGYKDPSPIQEKSIPIIMAGDDMIGQAQTGTGKTAAFALPILHRIKPTKRVTQALVLAPTRELALQVATAFETYGKNIQGINILAIYGGAPMLPQLKAIRNGTHIIVATPGRLCDHLRRDGKFLSSVNHLVLDEADEMLKLGFMEDLEIVFKALPESRQTALFSATLPRSIRSIAERHLKNPQHVKIQTKTQTVSAIEQVYLCIHADQKSSGILTLLETEDFDALIMFVRTKQATLDLASILELQGYKAAALNGDIVQKQRERVIDSLKDGRLDIVVATDVAARGLDVPRITHVLNVDMPYDPESYVHRIGRTGRAGRTGYALLLVTPRERRMLQVIERVTGQRINQINLPDAKTILNRRIQKLINTLAPLVESSESTYSKVLDGMAKEIGCTIDSLATALLQHISCKKSLVLEDIQSTNKPLVPRKSREQRGVSSAVDRGNRQRPRHILSLNQNRVRCRTPLGTRDGIAARNLLGAILNEGGVSRETVGKIQVRENFSLIEFPAEGLDELLLKLKDTRVSGKQLKIRLYRES